MNVKLLLLFLIAIGLSVPMVTYPEQPLVSINSASEGITHELPVQKPVKNKKIKDSTKGKRIFKKTLIGLGSGLVGAAVAGVSLLFYFLSWNLLI